MLHSPHLHLPGFLQHLNLTLSAPFFFFPGEGLSADKKDQGGPKSHRGHNPARDLESSRYCWNAGMAGRGQH